MSERWAEHQRHVLAELDRISFIVVGGRESVMALRERVARLEQQNEACEAERKEAIAKLSKLELRIAWYAGGLTVVIFLIGLGWKIFEVIEK